MAASRQAGARGRSKTGIAAALPGVWTIDASDHTSESDAPNPYAVTTLHIDKPINDWQPASQLTRWMMVIAIPLMVIGSAISVMEIESIVFSGPVMLVYGLILSWLTFRPAQRRFRWFAIACLVYPLIVFLIIFLQSWSPSEAQSPISALCCTFTLVVSILIIRSRPLAENEPADGVSGSQFQLPTSAGDSGEAVQLDSGAIAPAKAP